MPRACTALSRGHPRNFAPAAATPKTPHKVLGHQPCVKSLGASIASPTRAVVSYPTIAPSRKLRPRPRYFSAMAMSAGIIMPPMQVPAPL